MDIFHKLDSEEGEYQVYINASNSDVEYLQRLSLMFLIEQDMFPFRLLKESDRCNFHDTPETIQ